MSPERRRRIEDLFEAALQCPPEERSRFLAEQCHDDAALRDQLDAMLLHQGGDTVEQIVQQAASTIVETRDAWKGRRLGLYRIVRILGKGGMGRSPRRTRRRPSTTGKSRSRP